MERQNCMSVITNIVCVSAVELLLDAVFNDGDDSHVKVESI